MELMKSPPKDICDILTLNLEIICLEKKRFVSHLDEDKGDNV